MRHSLALFALLSLASAAEAVVPTTAEVARAVRAGCPDLKGTISRAHCQDFGADEPTEAVCSYTVSKGSKRIKDKTYFAVDSKGWHLIDTPAYCPGQK